jgi:hypothetical protein
MGIDEGSMIAIYSNETISVLHRGSMSIDSDGPDGTTSERSCRQEENPYTGESLENEPAPHTPPVC